MLISQRPALTEESINETRSRFTIEPLEPGFGYTLGNSLRRTLLSSIPGAAVTSIKVDGVLHEFTTIPGVKEDVVELVMNVKDLCVSSEHDEPVSMYLRKQGPGDVTAGDIQPPAGVTVHNPDLKLATLNGKGRLDMELTVERGRGYVSAAQNKQSGQEIGRIPVDSIYSPVLKVTYRVEATRVEQRTDFDRLIIDVETKPSITPRTALASAGSTLVELFGLARELDETRRGHRHRTVAAGRAARRRPGAADRGAGPHRPVVQLPQARGHQLGRRAHRPYRGGPARHPQLRPEVDRRGQDEARRAWVWGSRTRRRCSTRRTSWTRSPTSTTTARTTARPSSCNVRQHSEGAPTMPTPTKGPRLGGSPAHERLMLANLATSLFKHGKITTTETKAQAAAAAGRAAGHLRQAG